MGYLLLDKVYEGVHYQARVVENQIIIFIDSIKLCELNAWDYSKQDVELIVVLECARVPTYSWGTVSKSSLSIDNNILV